MAEDPDFRRDRMESPEGRGIAWARWAAYHHSLPEDVLQLAYGTASGSSDASELDPGLLDDIAVDVIETSELVGFWIAWHRAGGFANLERGGWHRATIFRKVRRFRARFGAHPDEFRFPWLKLDLKRDWTDDLHHRLVHAAGHLPAE